jgi:predicted kinase/DNA-binding XRE family transcriptional regulator
VTDKLTVTAARKALGRQLAELRGAAALTQADLASLASFSRSTVANVEAGYQSAGPKFWRKCDEVLETGGALRTAYDDLENLNRDVHRSAAAAADGERRSVMDSQRQGGSTTTARPSVEPVISEALTTLMRPRRGTDTDAHDLESRVLHAYQHHRDEAHDPLSLVLVGGFAGSGKTEFARFLSAVTGWTILDKDTLTRALVEQLLLAHGSDVNDRHTPFYVEQVRPFEYRCLLDATRDNLRCGVSTVVTAPFAREFGDGDWFKRLQNRCAAQGARLSAVWMQCDEASMRDYIAYRGAARDSWKLNNWADYLATINCDFAPPFEHHAVDNRLNAAVALADQACTVAERVRA